MDYFFQIKPLCVLEQVQQPHDDIVEQLHLFNGGYEVFDFDESLCDLVSVQARQLSINIIILIVLIIGFVHLVNSNNRDIIFVNIVNIVNIKPHIIRLNFNLFSNSIFLI
jgi:hypothetical protein